MSDALVCMNQSLYDKAVCNVFGFTDVQEDATWLQDFADAIRGAWDGAPKDNQVPDWTLNDITVSFIEGAEIAYSITVPFTDGVLQGAGVGTGLPTTNALLTSLGHVGPRPNRGRVYFTGLTEATQDDSAWEIGTRGAFKALIDNFVDGIGPAPGPATMVIMRRPSAKFETYSWNFVDTVTSRLYPATQRRRRLSS